MDTRNSIVHLFPGGEVLLKKEQTPFDQDLKAGLTGACEGHGISAVGPVPWFSGRCCSVIALYK